MASPPCGAQESRAEGWEVGEGREGNGISLNSGHRLGGLVPRGVSFLRHDFKGVTSLLLPQFSVV